MPLPTPEKPDLRLLTKVEFAIDNPDPELREVDAAKVREIFGRCGAQTAHDVIELGCTGLAEYGVSIDESKWVRDRMGGARFSLTCFVPPDRHCLVHETSGGLQVRKLANEEQKQRHGGMVPQISRELEPEEAIHLSLVENAMRLERRQKEAKDFLSGQKMPDDMKLPPTWESSGGSEKPRVPAIEMKQQLNEIDSSSVCPEHAKTFWNCRFCIASEIARGDLVPTLLIGATDEDTVGLAADDIKKVEGLAVENQLTKYTAAGAKRVVLMVRVAVWTYKLAR